jgi:hypothetical protein
VAAQEPDDQFRLGAAGDDRHRHVQAVHDLDPSDPVAAEGPLLARHSDRLIAT